MCKNLPLNCKNFKTKYILKHLNIQINDNWNITLTCIQMCHATKNSFYRGASLRKHNTQVSIFKTILVLE